MLLWYKSKGMDGIFLMSQDSVCCQNWASDRDKQALTESPLGVVLYSIWIREYSLPSYREKW